MKKLTYILSLIIIISIFSGCKKYKEGPLVSFRSPINRIEGKWKVEKYLISGIDSIALINCRQINLTTIASTEYDYIWDYTVSDCIESYLENQTSQWSFDHATELDYKRVYLHPFFIDSINYGPFNNICSNFIILKLTNNKMVLESENPNSNYRIELEKIE